MDNQIPETAVNPEATPEDRPEDRPTEFDAEAAVEQFDLTRKARTDALEQIEKLLTQVSKGYNMDKKETIKCLKHFYVLCLMQDMLVRGLMADFVNSIRSVAKTEVEVFNLSAKVFTLTQGLYKKGLMTQDDLEQIYKEVTMPQLLAQLQPQTEGVEKEEDKG